MKNTDIAMIVLIASVGMLVSYFVVNAIVGDVYDGSATVKTIDLIEPGVVEPDPRIFNEDAINPAIPVEITGTDADVDTQSDETRDEE